VVEKISSLLDPTEKTLENSLVAWKNPSDFQGSDFSVFEKTWF